MATAEKILSVKLNASEAINGIKGLNDIIATNKRLLAEMEVQGKKNTQEYHVLAEQTKVLSSEKRTLQKEVRNEIKAQSELDGSLKQMRAQLSNLTKEYDSLSKAERNLGNRGKELKAQINQLTTEIKSAEEGTQRYYRNVGNYQNAILNAIGLNNNFGRSLLGIASSEKTVSGAFTAMGNSVKAFGSTLMGLLTNPVFLAVAGIAGTAMAAKWWYDYNVGVSEALRLTREFTGLAGKELNDLRASIQATADTYGKEYKETLQGVDVLMSTFDIDAERALKTINDGFQAGADLNGDMLSKIEQLAPAFKNAGMSAEQLVALIAQTRSGIFSDKGLEAIQMGTSRIRQFSDNMKKALQGIGLDAEEMARKLRGGELTPFDALTQIASKLQEIPPNSQEAGKVMNEVFGKAGKLLSTEMVQGLADMSTNLDEVKGKTGDYGKEVDNLREKNEQLNKAVDDLFGVTGEGLDVTTTKIKILYKDGLLRVVKGLQSIVNWMKNLWNSSKAVRFAFVSLANIIHTTWMVAMIPIKLVIGGIKTIGDVIVAVSKTFGQLKANIVNTFSGLANIFRGIFSGDGDMIAEGWQKAKNSAVGAVTNFASSVKTTFDVVGGHVKDFWSGMKDDVVDWAKFTSNAIDYTFDMGGGDDVVSYSTDPERILNDDDTTDNNKRPNKPASKGGGKSNTSRTNNVSKKAQERAALAKQLIAEANRLQQKALEEEAKTSIEGIEKMYDAQKAAIIERYSALGTLTADEQKAYDALLKNNEDARLQAIGAFKEKQLQEWEKMQKDEHDKATKYAQTVLDATKDGSLEQLKWQLEVMRLQMEAELAMYEDNEEMKTAIREKYNMMALKAQQDYANQQVTIEQEKYTAMAEVSGQLGELAGAFADDSKAAAIASKTLALGQIMISQAVAIANAVRAGSAATNPWQMIAQIAASVTAVTVAMVQAFKSLDDAKFATGGYIQGAGTSTSDSIPVRVSNGESIMNANTTAMFGGLLSSLNQLGGGVPIQVAQTSQSVQGEDMLARAVARGVAMLPAPVVSVADINEGQRRVEVITERAML